MTDQSEAYKLATEAGREATKQLIVVAGGLLAGYLTFLGRPGTSQILDVSYARWVIALLFASLFLGALSLAFIYLMHAARSRHLSPKRRPTDGGFVALWERLGIYATVGGFVCCLVAILVIVVTAIC